VIDDAVVLRDGRRLAYRQYGPADGRPLLFLPGAGLGRLMRFGEDALADRHVRLLSIDRPGLGASSPHPVKTFASVAADLAALVDAVVGEPVTVVANSQGAPFGLAFATTGRARGAVLVSPIDDVGHPPTTALLPADYRALVAEVAADPEAAMRRFSAFTAAELFAMMTGDHPPADQPIYDDPGFRSMLRTALDDGFASGADGYARDTMLAMSPWPAQLFEPVVGVRILIGAHDRVHSPDGAATLTGRIRGARRAVVDDAGGALLWSHPHLVLDAATITP